LTTGLFGKGQFNVGHICSRLQCDLGRSDHVALRWVAPNLETTSYTFEDLERKSSAFANALRELGFRKGDTLFIVLAKRPEVFFAVLGALKLELVVATPFHRLGEQALVDRMRQAGAKGLVTSRRSAKRVAELRRQVPSLDTIVLLDVDEQQADGVLSYRLITDAASETFLAPRTEASVPAMLHSTPSPSGAARHAVQAHGSLSHISDTARDVLQLTPDELFWCTADHGWVTGTSYGIMGPWSLGVAQVHFGGGYTAATWLGLLERQGVTIWYSAPTALRMLMREDRALLESFRLDRLKYIFTVGEWLNPEVIEWVREVFGREVYDTYFQTETGGIVIANRPGLPVRPGSMGRAVKGIVADVWHGDRRSAVDEGQLRLRAGWPSMFVGYLNEEEVYRAKFSEVHYQTGDIVVKDGDGYYWWRRRADDMINTAGHLVGSGEVERAVLELPEVAACGVVGVPDPVLLERVAAFVVLAPPYQPSQEFEFQLRLHVTRRLSPIAAPQEVRFMDALPSPTGSETLHDALRALWRARTPDRDPASGAACETT
jgi:acetyl-CoA synthetase